MKDEIIVFLTSIKLDNSLSIYDDFLKILKSWKDKGLSHTEAKYVINSINEDFIFTNELQEDVYLEGANIIYGNCSQFKMIWS